MGRGERVEYVLLTSRTPGPASLLPDTSRLVSDRHSERGDTASASPREFFEILNVCKAGRHDSPPVDSMRF